MISVYTLFIVSAVISILLYCAPKTAVKVGFGLGAISCFYASFWAALSYMRQNLL